MPRQLRHHVPGGWYHLTARGIGRRTVFETDREHCLELLGCMAERYGVVLHAYVLMGKNDHLLVERNDFVWVSDGWVHVTPCGEFPHAGAGVVQIIDRAA